MVKSKIIANGIRNTTINNSSNKFGCEVSCQVYTHTSEKWDHNMESSIIAWSIIWATNGPKYNFFSFPVPLSQQNSHKVCLWWIFIVKSFHQSVKYRAINSRFASCVLHNDNSCITNWKIHISEYLQLEYNDQHSFLLNVWILLDLSPSFF